ncbi:FAD-dependent monooxygenase [Subtercola sp. YIM 133946]|uniref:FAD-dependent monooxygenase n=1 Tax=Subtercola sp. YIM 133946 TaxID=3118909 RepID=UPI002F94BC76
MSAAVFDLDALPPHVRVLVSGGGPSGLVCALELAHRGIPSLVVEPRVGVDPNRPRAKTTNARTMTHLRRLGLADALRAAAPLSADYSETVIFCSHLLGFEVRRFEHAFQLHRERYELQPEAGQQVAQPIVEEVLRAAVVASPLITFATGLSVTSVDGRAVTVATPASTEPGRAREVTADFIVGADGSGSAVRRSLGIALQGGSAARSNLNVLFRSPGLAERVALDDAVQYWVMAPGASGIIGRADLDDTWWAIIQGVDVTAPDLDPVALVRTMVGADVAVDVIATDPWTARMLLAEHYGSGTSAGGSFLVGDAAHLNPPWGGHGFNTCVADAVNLAWKIAAGIQGWAGEALLDSYELERRPVAARTISDAANNGGRLANDFADAVLGVDSAAGEALRAAAHDALEVKRSEFSSLGLVLGYSYADSPIVAREPGAAPAEDPITYVPSAHPGMLLPHGWLADGRSVYDLLVDTGFTLLVDARTALDARQPLDGLESPHGVPVTVVELDAPALFDLWGAPAVLVRPDQHVAWRGSSLADVPAALDLAAGWGAAAEPAAAEPGATETAAPEAAAATAAPALTHGARR